jgi:hypothetical protein
LPDNAEQYDFANEPEVTLPEAPPVSQPADGAAPPASAGPVLPKGAGGKFLSPKLVDQARTLGMTDDEISSYEPTELREAVRDALIYRLHERSAQPPVSTPAPQPVAPLQAPKEVERPQAATLQVDELDWGKGEDGVPYTEKDYPSHIAGLMKTVHAQGQTIKALQAQIGQVNQYVEGQVNQTLTQQADAFFAENAEVFGSESADKIDRSSIEFERRNTVIGRLKDQKDGSFRQRLEKAAAIFVTQPKQPAPVAPRPASRNEQAQPVIVTKETWDQGTLAPATHRQGAPEPKGILAAKRAFLQGDRELALANGQADDIDF